MRKLLELLEIVYWHNEDKCKTEFDVNSESCKGSGRGECNNYEFCKKYNEFKTQLKRAGLV